MNTTAACESCGMPIETGRYCSYCTDDDGQLQSFEERFTRMTAWQARAQPGHAARGDRTPDARIHGHHASLAPSSPRHLGPILTAARS